MLRNVIFVPGHGKEVKDYPMTCGKLEDSGLAVDEVFIDWDQKFESLIKQAEHELRIKIGHETLVIAHSAGVNIALPEIVRHPGIGFVMASPGITCAEGYEFEVGRTIIEEYFPDEYEIVQKFSLTALTKTIQTPPERVAVFVGEAEVERYPFMGKLAQDVAHPIGIEAIRVPSAPHSIEDSVQYQQAVADAAVRISKRVS